MRAVYYIVGTVAGVALILGSAPARRFSPSSRRNLAGVHPDLVRLAEAALARGPFDFAVTSGLRTDAEQQRLFDEGFSACNPTSGCVGKHTLGRAIDIAPIVGAQPDFSDASKVRALAPQVKAAARELGIAIKWLGEPGSRFDDPFHWELV